MNHTTLSPIQNLAQEETGAVAMEFGLVAIVFITMLLGMLDIGQVTYTQAVLNGAAQEVARSSSLESRNTAAADADIERLVKTIAPNAKVTPRRVSYYDFADIGRAEKWTDEDSDGECNNDENFVDENGNGEWDADIGLVDDIGGASDVVIYTVSVEYKPLFAIPFVDNEDSKRELSTTIVKKNQPFQRQAEYDTSTGVCS